MPAVASENVLTMLSRPGSMTEVFARMMACTVAVQASDPGFLALVAPETLGFLPANQPYIPVPNAHNVVLGGAYAAGDLEHGSDLAVALGGGR